MCFAGLEHFGARQSKGDAGTWPLFCRVVRPAAFYSGSGAQLCHSAFFDLCCWLWWLALLAVVNFVYVVALELFDNILITTWCAAAGGPSTSTLPGQVLLGDGLWGLGGSGLLPLQDLPAKQL